LVEFNQLLISPQPIQLLLPVINSPYTFILIS
jgi:hypothetical protein